MRRPLSDCSGFFSLSLSKSSTTATTTAVVVFALPMHLLRIHLSELGVVAAVASSIDGIGPEISSYYLDSSVTISNAVVAIAATTTTTTTGRTSFWKKYSQLRKENACLGNNFAQSISAGSFLFVTESCLYFLESPISLSEKMDAAFILRLIFSQ